MNITEIGQDLAEVLKNHQIPNYLLIAAPEGTDSVAIASVGAHTGADVSSMFHSLAAAMFPLMAAKNGLPPRTSAAAMKALIDEALEDYERYQEEQHAKAGRELDAALRDLGSRS